MAAASNAAPRSTTPSPAPANTRANDHIVSFRHKLSLREYPPDCPPLIVRWFYAVDVPKRKPFAGQAPAKPLKPPAKFVPFGPRDSREIEAAFQKLSEEEDAVDRGSSSYSRHIEGGDLGGPGKGALGSGAKVPVNEDYLFDVDIKSRELAPVYWLGPVYDVRRGTWFFQGIYGRQLVLLSVGLADLWVEGSSQRPCDENLATQIEDGYLRIKPFRNPQSEIQKTKNYAADANPLKATIDTPSAAVAEDVSPRTATPVLREPSAPGPNSQSQQQTWRLFGSHMNSFVVYVDANTAWLLTDDFYGKLSSTVFQRITAGTHMGGQKLVRGYTEAKPKDVSRPITPNLGERDRKGDKDEMDKKYKRKSMPPPLATPKPLEDEMDHDHGRKALQRKMSSLAAGEGDDETQQKMLESEMKDDYRADEATDDPGREIEHLLLVTHGIGQKLGMRTESVNFVHDVNVFRKTLKTVYGIAPDLQALNDELGEGKKNCRVQCLPVCWRHHLDFPKQSLKSNRGEHDLSSGSTGHYDEYPTLADITVEGVPAIRSLMTDLALDVLLYQSATYREHIIQTVLAECNRIYALFKQRNPEFRGKVSLVGHSLGAAILFDILCRQAMGDGMVGQPLPKKMASGKTEMQLGFPVENFFCLGSPVGLFQMLKGCTIASRSFYDPSLMPKETLLSELADASFLSASAEPSSAQQRPQQRGTSAFEVSSPECGQLFNIFHPTDPIAYRIEPLVSKAMAELKPQPLPYTKRGLFNSGQLVGGISGIGQTVSRSVSSMWTSFSSGIASSLLNRSLGFNDTAPPAAPAGIDSERTNWSERQPEVEHQQRPPTLIDGEIETLYAGFQKRRRSAVEGEEGKKEEDEQEKIDAEEKAAQLKIEEAKVRALNATGRIDFAIQEGVFDISLIASIASHLNYWGDEDVSHFTISQLLARQRVMRKGNVGGRNEWSSARI